MTVLRRGYHQARWDEPLIFELGTPGARGHLPPETPSDMTAAATESVSRLPEILKRDEKAMNLPEMSEPEVLRHYTRLSQMCLGVDVAVDMVGTCTMKYSPKVNEALTQTPRMQAIHPRQLDGTMQGLLEILCRFADIISEIAGLPAVSFQPAGGSQGIYTNACLIRAWHTARGDTRRDEIITTAFSHPADPAAAATAGFRVITLAPGERGYPELPALRAALSERTAGLILTNPEDTGLFNPNVSDFVKEVHAAGGLCAWDQANANGLLGVMRAGDLGFDLCQFNLHKTFSAPHSSNGQACAAVCTSDALASFLPVPVPVRRDGGFALDWDRPQSIGKIRSFLGNAQVVVKAYAWVMALGADGLRAVADTAVMNSRYINRALAALDGIAMPFRPDDPRLEQARYSLDQLAENTGVGSHDVKLAMLDYGLQHFFESHHPVLVPEPATIEPGESYSLAEIEEYIGVIRDILEKARQASNSVTSAPHKAAMRKDDGEATQSPDQGAMTWRAWQRKQA